MSENDFVAGGERIQQIASAEVGIGRTLDIVWTTGEKVIVDISPIIASHQAFERLRHDDIYFSQMKVDEWGWAVCWPGDPGCAIPSSTLQRYVAQQSRDSAI